MPSKQPPEGCPEGPIDRFVWGLAIAITAVAVPVVTVVAVLKITGVF